MTGAWWAGALGGKAWARNMTALSALGTECIVLGVANGPWTDGIARTELYLFADDALLGWRNACDYTPDLECDATRGAMLGILRRLYASEIYAMPANGEWYVQDPVAYDTIGAGKTEAEALVDAAEAWRASQPTEPA
jgi:hypothetical protein